MYKLYVTTLAIVFINIFVMCLGLGLGVKSLLTTGFSFGRGEGLPGLAADRDCITLLFSKREVVLYLVIRDISLCKAFFLIVGDGGRGSRGDFISL